MYDPSQDLTDEQKLEVIRRYVALSSRLAICLLISVVANVIMAFS